MVLRDRRVLAEPVDQAALARIRDEGLNRSQVMETAFWLTDRYGLRSIALPAISTGTFGFPILSDLGESLRR